MTVEILGELLFSLEIPEESIRQSQEIFCSSVPLQKVLEHPAICQEEKQSVIEKIFPKGMQSFWKVLCNYGKSSDFLNIVDCWEEKWLAQQNKMKATLYCVTEPEPETLEKLKAFLCQKEKKTEVFLTVKKDPSLIGGFMLQAGNTEYDRSFKGAIKRLQKEAFLKQA